MQRTYWWDEVKFDNNIYNYDNEFRYKNEELVSVSTPLGTVHDPKARKIGVCGHAGIISCTDDINKFSRALLSRNIISEESIHLLTSDRYDAYDMDEKHFGLLCSKKTDNQYNEILPGAGTGSIAISGYTGTYYCVDFSNGAYIFIGADRIRNRLTMKEREPDKRYIRCTNQFAYRRDELRDALYCTLS